MFYSRSPYSQALQTVGPNTYGLNTSSLDHRMAYFMTRPQAADTWCIPAWRVALVVHLQWYTRRGGGIKNTPTSPCTVISLKIVTFILPWIIVNRELVNTTPQFGSIVVICGQFNLIPVLKSKLVAFSPDFKIFHNHLFMVVFRSYLVMW